jgi:hypothetical protein
VTKEPSKTATVKGQRTVGNAVMQAGLDIYDIGLSEHRGSSGPTSLIAVRDGRGGRKSNECTRGLNEFCNIWSGAQTDDATHRPAQAEESFLHRREAVR